MAACLRGRPQWKAVINACGWREDGLEQGDEKRKYMGKGRGVGGTVSSPTKIEREKKSCVYVCVVVCKCVYVIVCLQLVVAAMPC